MYTLFKLFKGKREYDSTAHAACHLSSGILMQDDKSRESSRRSEADSEEAAQDVCALSQEGSLGSFSDSDLSFKLRMAAAAECVYAPSACCKLPSVSMGWTPETQLQHRQGFVVCVSGKLGPHSSTSGQQ